MYSKLVGFASLYPLHTVLQVSQAGSCPTGKSLPRFSRSPKVQPLWQKFFAFAVGQNIFRDSPVSRSDREGRIAIVTTRWARDAMDGESVRRDFWSRRTRRFPHTAKSCGPGAATLASSLQVVTRRWRWQESPFTGEITK